jgi:hypothetical protein
VVHGGPPDQSCGSRVGQRFYQPGIVYIRGFTELSSCHKRKIRHTAGKQEEAAGGSSRKREGHPDQVGAFSECESCELVGCLCPGCAFCRQKMEKCRNGDSDDLDGATVGCCPTIRRPGDCFCFTTAPLGICGCDVTTPLSSWMVRAAVCPPPDNSTSYLTVRAWIIARRRLVSQSRDSALVTCERNRVPGVTKIEMKEMKK